MRYFTKDHEWLTLEGEIATVGITRFAAEALGDLVFAEVKPVGAALKAGEGAAVVESVKAASDIYAPLAGEVVEVNPQVEADAAVVNADPEGEGWLFKLRLADPGAVSGLLDQAAYDQHTGAA